MSSRVQRGGAAGLLPWLTITPSDTLHSLTLGQGVGKLPSSEPGPLPTPCACQPLICSMFL